MVKVFVNGIDLSKMVHRHGLSVQEKKKFGQGGGLTLSGKTIVDLLAVKKTVTATFNPLTTAQKDRVSSLCNAATVNLRYAVDGSADQTIEAQPTMSNAQTKLAVNGVMWWDGISVTFEEV